MKKEIFFKSASKLAWQGGIMEIKPIELNGRSFSLLKQANYHKDGNLYLDYDYIYESKISQVVLNKKKQKFESLNTEGIGATLRAICALYELCFDCSLIQDTKQLIDRRNQIAWINRVLDEQITDRRTTDAWEIYEHLHEWNLLDKENEVMEQSNYLLGEMLSVVKYMYVSKGKNGLKILQDFKQRSQEEPTIHVVDLIAQAIEVIEGIKRNTKHDVVEEANKLLGILKLSRKEKLLLEKEDDLTHYIIYSIVLPPEILVKAIADTFDLDFWDCWKEIKGSNSFENIWKSSDPASYDSPEYMDTSEFLNRCNGTFHNRSKRNQMVQDTSLIYCLDDQEQRSKKIEELLFKLKEDYDSILQVNSDKEFSKRELSEILSKLESFNLFVFETWFDDFTVHKKEAAYQGAWLLIEKMVAEIQKEASKRELKKKRLEIKGLLALLANIPLRNKILGF